MSAPTVNADLAAEVAADLRHAEQTLRHRLHLRRRSRTSFYTTTPTPLIELLQLAYWFDPISTRSRHERMRLRTFDQRALVVLYRTGSVSCQGVDAEAFADILAGACGVDEADDEPDEPLTAPSDRA